MGVGHLALGFATRPIAPRTSLGLLLVAGLFVDLVWVVLVVAGIEHARIVPGITAANPFDLYDYPVSHSLVAGYVGPPPPDMNAVAGGSAFVLLLLLAADVVDRHRELA